MLIDFDCAIVESDKSASIRPGRTGTLPFMSIANLERMDIQHTVLDDWESLLYLVCWLATFGINRKNDREDEDEHIPIKSWSSDSPSITAREKRNHLDSVRSFRVNILKHFQKKQDLWGALYHLARRLHESLFFNGNLDEKVRMRCHGATDDLLEEPDDDLIMEESDGSGDNRDTHSENGLNKDSSEEVNPFVERITHAKSLTKDLLEVLSKSAALAYKRMK
ncbi:hypothetical protein GGI26_005519 [Coemansia sp. RSA 1358]|nr:hypothetical protein GGI26_005519 [Coemansia sp. RSA 1358]